MEHALTAPSMALSPSCRVAGAQVTDGAVLAGWN